MSTTYEIVVSLEKSFFYSEETNFGIAAVTMPSTTADSNSISINTYGNFTLKGIMPKLTYGKKYVAKVVPKRDDKYGMGYEVKSIYEQRPTTKDELKSFLGAILTDNQVTELFKTYPDSDVVDLIAKDELDYTKVKGLGEKNYVLVKQKVIENMEYREAIVELSEKYGLSPRIIKKMSESYGSTTLLVQKVKEDPYVLADDVDGIGFKKADAIALRNGMDKQSSKRIRSCIIYTLKEEANNGHSWISKKKLSKGVSENIAIKASDILIFIETGLTGNSVHIEGDRVALISNYRAESGIATHVKRLLSFENNFHTFDVENKIDAIEQEQSFEFTDEQRAAIKLAIEKNVIIINGKAGTGKTSVLKGLLKVMIGENLKNQVDSNIIYKTCALSGKASQRIQESTGLDSATIHRLLGFKANGGFTHNEENPLIGHIFVLDEASMVNSQIFNMLIRAIPDGAKFIILGDSSQLEPIGVGNVFFDLINSELVPRVELTKVHRQAMKSGILSVANEVREGNVFVEDGDYEKKRLGELQDLLFYPFKNPDNVKNAVIKIAEKFTGNIMDFQVIVPMKSRGELSTKSLNPVLQDIFNEDDGTKRKLERKNVTFREGDKVIQNGNNYDKGVFNGTLGIIDFIDEVSKFAIIVYDGVGRVEYKNDELIQIDLAYALTVHRTQGSQFKNVLIALDYSSYMLLSRQLIYTAITRAEKVAYLAVELTALQHAIRTDKSTKRNTFLADLLTTTNT